MTLKFRVVSRWLIVLCLRFKRRIMGLWVGVRLLTSYRSGLVPSMKLDDNRRPNRRRSIAVFESVRKDTPFIRNVAAGTAKIGCHLLTIFDIV
jgi:hypothetical protein